MYFARSFFLREYTFVLFYGLSYNSFCHAECHEVPHHFIGVLFAKYSTPEGKICLIIIFKC